MPASVVCDAIGTALGRLLATVASLTARRQLVCRPRHRARPADLTTSADGLPNRGAARRVQRAGRHARRRPQPVIGAHKFARAALQAVVAPDRDAAVAVALGAARALPSRGAQHAWRADV